MQDIRTLWTRRAHSLLGRALVVAVAALPLTWVGALAANAAPATTTSGYLDSVACATTSSCVAVGTTSNASGAEIPFAEVWNGKAWSQSSVPEPTGANTAILYGVSCASASSCTAVGIYHKGPNTSATWPSLVEHWNGASWVLQSAPPPSTGQEIWLMGVSCPTTTSCTAVGYLQHATGDADSAIVEHWNGAAWATQSFPGGTTGSPSLSGVSCSSATSCVAVGSRLSATLDGSVQVVGAWNGKTWSLQPASAVSGAKDTLLTSVSCTSATTCTAAGYYDPADGGAENVVEQWKNAGWTIEKSPGPAGSTSSSLAGVDCTAPSACTVVGSLEAGATLADRWNGTSWSLQATPKPAHTVLNWLNSVACVSATWCTAVGQSTDVASYSGPFTPLVEHWNGTTWTVQ
jgi:hypothetical protein